MRTLVRPARGRILAGVCAAIATRLGISNWVARVLWIVLSLFPGPMWVLYVVLWVIIPSEASRTRRADRR